ncbi:MAG: phosphatase PAP2 family protein [Microthrixaceae bacterium]
MDDLHPTGALRAVDRGAHALVARTCANPSVDRLMYLLSGLGDDGRIWIGAAAFEALRRDRPGARFLHSVAWLGIESAVVNLGMKRLVRRPRPAGGREHTHELRRPTDTSFPSGHAASAATMAVLLSEGSPLAPAYGLLAVGIGVSRVHVGVHHGSDVAAGWAVGVLFGLLARRTGAELFRPTSPG